MENEREEDYIVGVTMEFYVQGITYCFLIFFYLLPTSSPPSALNLGSCI